MARTLFQTVAEAMTVDADRGAFGHVLRRLRAQSGLSQEELAERAGLSVESISALERGRRRAPYRTTIGLLADALAASSDERAELEAAAKRRGPRVNVSAYDSLDAANRQSETRFGPGPRRHNLVRPLNSFAGREQELGDIDMLLAEHSLVSLVGAGGIGKTRVARQFGWTAIDRFADGVWFIDLAPLTDDALVARSVLTVLDIPGDAGGDLAALRNHLEGRETLLIIDNCEHVVDQVAVLVEALLSGCPDVHFLVTSREPLRIAGERVFRIPPLALPEASADISAARSLEFAAVRLFVDRAQAVDHGFAYTDRVAQATVQVCRRLDGMALAIELAASRAAALSPAQMLAQLGASFGVLSGGNRTLVQRHRTMDETIRWSYDRLAPAEQAVFRGVAIFIGGFTYEAAQSMTLAVTGNSLEADEIAALVDRSLLVTEAREGLVRYRLLEPIRAFGLAELERVGEQAEVRDAFSAWCLAFAREAHSGWETLTGPAWLALVEPEMDNIRAALIWALDERHDVESGQRLIGASRRIWGRLFPSEGRRWISAASSLVDERTPRDVAAALALAQIHLDIALEQYTSALSAAQRYEGLRADDTDELGPAEARAFAGCALVKLGQVDDGEALIAESLRVYRARGVKQLIAHGVLFLGIAHLIREDLPATRRLLREAFSLFRQVGNDRGASSAAANLAEVEFKAGDAAAAVQLCEQALATFGNGREARLHLTNLSAYLVSLERYADARAKARESILCGGIARADVDVAFALQHLAAIAAFRAAAPSDDDELVRAARLVGFIDTRLDEFAVIREFTEQREYDRLMERLQGRFASGRLAELRADGSRWDEDEAVDEAMQI